MHVKDTIDEQMKQYAMCNEDLNDIQDQLNNMDENDANYDHITPGTENIECQDEDFGGVSIIAIDDLFQLGPVMDGYIFQILTILIMQFFLLINGKNILRNYETKGKQGVC